jgi:fibro-slime domain-containing protein
VSTARFRYQGGEHFRFEGDDDVWVFVNRRLAVDLGGIHSSERAIADLDAQADALEITAGGVYELHFFFAERQTTGSTFHVQTTIAEFDRCE